MNIHAKFKFTDIIYEKKQGVAWVTINRPDSYNSVTQH